VHPRWRIGKLQTLVGRPWDLQRLPCDQTRPGPLRRFPPGYRRPSAQYRKLPRESSERVWPQMGCRGCVHFDGVPRCSMQRVGPWHRQSMRFGRPSGRMCATSTRGTSRLRDSADRTGRRPRDRLFGPSRRAITEGLRTAFLRRLTRTFRRRQDDHRGDIASSFPPCDGGLDAGFRA
jgi:hypothetical protein